MPDDLDAMTDEQLNDTVATEVFGWPADSPGRLAYATDGNAMLEVIEKMRAEWWWTMTAECGGWSVALDRISKISVKTALNRSIPRAVAIAAVRAKRAAKQGAMT